MKRYFLSVTVVIALGACQAEEPMNTGPAMNETVPTATQSVTVPVAPVQKAVEKSAAVVNEAGVQAEQAVKETLTEASQVKEQLGSQIKGNPTAIAPAVQSKAPLASTEASTPAMPPVAAIKPSVAPKPVASAPSPVMKHNSGDAAKGLIVARKCAVCHNFDAKKKMGPGLAGMFGREAGSVAGFSYKFTAFIQPGKAWRWDEAHLSAWVCDSAKAVKNFTGDDSAKTKMGAQRICDPTAQTDLIAFLKTL